MLVPRLCADVAALVATRYEHGTNWDAYGRVWGRVSTRLLLSVMLSRARAARVERVPHVRGGREPRCAPGTGMRFSRRQVGNGRGCRLTHRYRTPWKQAFPTRSESVPKVFQGEPRWAHVSMAR